MKKLLFCALGLAVLLSGCGKTSEEEPPKGDYVTLTVTGYDNRDDSADGMTVQVWCYDTASGDLKQMFSFPASAQYSLGFYDRAHQTVYYTQRQETDNALGYGDQIFAYDLNTQTETQLTTELFAVNDLFPAENRLYFAASTARDGVIRLGYLDLTTGELSFWREDGDTFVETMTVDAAHNRVYYVGYSMQERNDNVLHQGNGDFLIPIHTVYQTDLDFSETESLYSDHTWLRGILTHGTQIEVLSDEKYNRPELPSTVVSIDPETKSVQTAVWDGDCRLQQETPNYTSDSAAIYSIIATDDDRGVGRYDVETKDTELCFSTVDGNFINNMRVVYK